MPKDRSACYVEIAELEDPEDLGRFMSIPRGIVQFEVVNTSLGKEETRYLGEFVSYGRTDSGRMTIRDALHKAQYLKDPENARVNLDIDEEDERYLEQEDTALRVMIESDDPNVGMDLTDLPYVRSEIPAEEDLGEHLEEKYETYRAKVAGPLQSGQ